MPTVAGLRDVVVVRYQLLVDRSASLIATALISFAFGVVAVQMPASRPFTSSLPQ